MSLLALNDVEVTYERRDREPLRAVAGVSLTVEPGQIVGLVGESGCGKSTLAKAVVGLVPTSGGQIVFEGREVTPLTRRARPRELVRLQMVFQNPFSSLNPRRTIGAQLTEAALASGASRRVGRDRVGELLERVGLSASVASRYPHSSAAGSASASPLHGPWRRSRRSSSSTSRSPPSTRRRRHSSRTCSSSWRARSRSGCF